MTAKEALKRIEDAFKDLSESSILDTEEFKVIIQALEELEAIKSVDGGEALKVFWKIAKGYEERAYKSQYIPDKDYEDWEQNIIDLKNYILKAQAQEQELRELKKSDGNKEQSSIDYYNEMRKYKKELEELKKRDMAIKPVEAMITWQCGKCGKEIRNTFNSCPYCRTRIDWSGIYGSGKDE